MQVDSVYRRLKASGKASRDRQAKQIGDNCPLIYALKQSDGLWVSRSSIRQLKLHITWLVSELCRSLNVDVECIVVIQ